MTKRHILCTFLALIAFANPVLAQNTNPVLEEDNAMLDPQGFEVALLCTSALQITTLAAPNWANEPAIASASNLWLARLQEIAPENGVPVSQLNETITAKMRELTNESLKNPQYLNNLAFECAINSPS